LTADEPPSTRAAEAALVLAARDPVVAARKGERSQELGGPAALVERPEVGPGLEHEDAAPGIFAQSSGEDASRGPGSHDDHVVAHHLRIRRRR
jgi:hypothetical protein